jgi:hypothetical protein
MLKMLIPHRRSRSALALAAGLMMVFAALPAAAQAPRKTAFRAVNYEVNVALLPANQAISARAKVDFEAKEPSATVEVELHQDLGVQTVTGADGKPLTFQRYPDAPLRLSVTLPQTVIAGQRVTLTFDYSGPLANDDTSPIKGVRLAYVSDPSTLLLLPGRWFPVTDYPSNRYTALFQIAVPEGIVVAGTGEALPPQKRTVTFESDPGRPGQPKPKTPPDSKAPASTSRMVYTFRCTRPEAAGSFVAGKFEPQIAKSSVIPLTIYAPAGSPNLSDSFAQTLSGIVTYYSSEFGGLPESRLSVAQLPTGSLSGFSGPGLLLVSARQWDPKINYRLLAQLAAQQWFGSEVLPASPGDVWVTDGLTRYLEGMYVENLAGREALDRSLEDFAVGALMFEQAAPIGQAAQLAPFTPEYRSVVQNKGAMVFHMLRALLGDTDFRAVLRDFYSKFSGRTARIEDFVKLANERAAAAPLSPGKTALNLTPFFTQWLNSTGVPEFKLDYVVVRTRKGFLVRGTAKQDLETFRMPVELKVATEGNPEIKTIEVVGTKSDFTIETFGRPKPMGITIDPNNNLLKASAKLRVRAMIGRGEDLAGQGQFYEAIMEYQRALDLQRNSSLAHFRMGEAAFFQKNYQASATAFRDALEGDLEPKWVEVWSRLYLGKVFDLSGQRERALREYTKARDLRDDTGGAQSETERYIAQPFKLETQPSRTTP